MYQNGVSTYKGEEIGEGGKVYAEPGFYIDVALLDITSMHPTTIEILNLFGPYTKKFTEIKNARIFIKHGELDKVRNMLDGKLVKYLDVDNLEPDVKKKKLKELAQAFKMIINPVYGEQRQNLIIDLKILAI